MTLAELKAKMQRVKDLYEQKTAGAIAGKARAANFGTELEDEIARSGQAYKTETEQHSRAGTDYFNSFGGTVDDLRKDPNLASDPTYLMKTLERRQGDKRVDWLNKGENLANNKVGVADLVGRFANTASIQAQRDLDEASNLRENYNMSRQEVMDEQDRIAQAQALQLQRDQMNKSYGKGGANYVPTKAEEQDLIAFEMVNDELQYVTDPKIRNNARHLASTRGGVVALNYIRGIVDENGNPIKQPTGGGGGGGGGTNTGGGTTASKESTSQWWKRINEDPNSKLSKVKRMFFRGSDPTGLKARASGR